MITRDQWRHMDMSVELPARDPLLVEREKTHGDFGRNAYLWQKFCHEASSTTFENDAQRLAISMIFLKVARVLSNPKNADSWHDIAGYAKLGAEACEK